MDFEVNFDAQPAFWASLASFHGPDPAGLRYSNLDHNQVQIVIEEDQSLDLEVGHANEVVDFLAIAETGDLIATAYAAVDVI